MLRHYCLDSADSDATQEQEDILWQSLVRSFLHRWCWRSRSICCDSGDFRRVIVSFGTTICCRGSPSEIVTIKAAIKSDWMVEVASVDALPRPRTMI
jgi:hypothetical protein